MNNRENAKRLLWTLYCRSCDKDTIIKLAELLDYVPEDLRRDLLSCGNVEILEESEYATYKDFSEEF